MLQAAEKGGVIVKSECGISKIERKEGKFFIELSSGEYHPYDKVLIATGSAPKTYSWLESFGHTIAPQVPSLFTFNVPHSPFNSLAGISVPDAEVKIQGTSLKQRGPLLITHWGFSGPAVLKLSAWGARVLHDLKYSATALINWIPNTPMKHLRRSFWTKKSAYAARQISTEPLFELPRNLWKQLLLKADIQGDLRW